jgi:hypothetical protein
MLTNPFSSNGIVYNMTQSWALQIFDNRSSLMFWVSPLIATVFRLFTRCVSQLTANHKQCRKSANMPNAHVFVKNTA